MPSLTHAEAITRAALISVDAYTLDFDLTAVDRIFRSTSKILCTSTRAGAPTFVHVVPDRRVSAVLDGARPAVPGAARRHPARRLRPRVTRLPPGIPGAGDPRDHGRVLRPVPRAVRHPVPVREVRPGIRP